MAARSRPPSRTAFEIALLCVLKPERDSIELALDEVYEQDGHAYRRAPSDRNAYTTGRFGSNHGVIVYLPAMGNIDSAAAASTIRATFPSIQITLVVGVCGVYPRLQEDNGDKVILGDIAVSTGVVKAGSGRQFSDGLVLRERVECAPRPEVRSFLQKLQSTRSLEPTVRQDEDIRFIHSIIYWSDWFPSRSRSR
ncbi:hypothetical protein BJX70DRAFT_11387 [Aspergillus crustosus]